MKIQITAFVEVEDETDAALLVDEMHAFLSDSIRVEGDAEWVDFVPDIW